MEMNIRQGTEIRLVAGAIAAAGLAAAAALHILWASGSSWPAKDYDELADLVVGRGPFPSRPLTAIVAISLAGASSIAVLASRPAPSHSRLVRLGVKAVAVTLLARGVSGLVWSSLPGGKASPEYRHWDRRLYSPVCIVLGVCAAIGGRR